METIAEILPFGLRAKARQVDPGLRAASALCDVLPATEMIEHFC
jgi:hypothetical protein